jgi:hypothetical protein
MKDRLEGFVRSHSPEFDIHEPDDALWEKIRKEIEPKKVIRWRYYLSRAAIIIFLIGASLMGQRIWMKNNSGLSQKNAEVELNIPELQEAEMYYTGMINAKLEEVKPLLSEHPSLEIELNTDLSELDSIYAGLKNDLKDDIANQEVIEAMIQNYRLRISILEDLLNYLEPNKNMNETNNIEQL